MSELAGAKLTAGNPNVVDLNDQNRPTKLAERYMELYDNTWTDAFSALNDAGCDDEKAISILLQILKASLWKLMHFQGRQHYNKIVLASFLKGTDSKRKYFHRGANSFL